MSTPVMLSIAGSDCSAGAGIQADLKTGFALGSYPLTVLTCATAQVPGQVASIVPMSADFVAQQLRLCLQHFPVAAIKTGMLYSADIVRAVSQVLEEQTEGSTKGATQRIPLVIDPVMIASAGDSLMQDSALVAYEQGLFPLASLLTPNIDELRALLHWEEEIRTAPQLEKAGIALLEKYGCAILAKGGHLEGDECVDILIHRDGRTQSWAHPRVANVSTHGTGCTLSSAVTALLASGQELEQAVETALSYVSQAISNTHHWPQPAAKQALNHHR